jgi:hypothetical protein
MGDNQYQGTRAVSLSADGQVLGGWVSGPGIFWHPTIWNPDSTELGTWNPDYNMGDVAALNSDGTIAFGKAGGLYWPVPMYWSAATGLVNLTDTNLDYEGYAWCGSDDASIIGGDIGAWGNKYGFIWTPTDGMRPFTEWLADQGITLGSNWIISQVSDISADGKVIIAWGDNTDSPQTITDGLVIILEDAVPVELISFTASANNDIVNLNWSTATELNNSGFEIQRKNENSDWNPIGFIKGYGTTTTQNNYNYTDQSPVAGSNIYRLKQIDYDGTFDYSNEVEVEIVPAEYVLQQNYPNPFNPTTTINFNTPKEDFVNVTIYNSLGEKVATLLDGVLSGGSHALTFDATGLASGLYILKMSSGSFSNTIKMNLMK